MEKLDITELMNEISEEDFNQYRKEVKQILKNTIEHIGCLKGSIEREQSRLKTAEEYLEKVKELATNLKDIPYDDDGDCVRIYGPK